MRVRFMNLLRRREHSPLNGWRRFVRDNTGAVAVVVALAATGLAGVMGLGIEVPSWYMATPQAADCSGIRRR
jgi:hypothetical protein